MENKGKIIFVLLPYSKQVDTLGFKQQDLAEKIINNYLNKYNFIFLDVKKLFSKIVHQKVFF